MTRTARVTARPRIASVGDAATLGLKIIQRIPISGVALPEPSLSLSATQSQVEGAAFQWTLTLDRDGSTIAYPYSWAAAGSGSNPANTSDFNPTSGTGTFAAGETSKTITINSIDDATVEPNETFTLTVTAPNLNTVTSVGTITDNDVAPSPTQDNTNANSSLMPSQVSGLSARMMALDADITALENA